MPATTCPAGVPTGRPARGTAGPGAFGPVLLLSAWATGTRCGGAYGQARTAVRTRRPVDHPAPHAATTSDTTRYGTARARAWTRPHPRFTRRAARQPHDGEL